MACFSLAAILSLLIWLVVIAAIIMLIRLLVPWLLSLAGGEVPSPIGQAINIVLWAILVIVGLYVLFWLLSCLIGGPLSLPFPRR